VKLYAAPQKRTVHSICQESSASTLSPQLPSGAFVAGDNCAFGLAEQATLGVVHQFRHDTPYDVVSPLDGSRRFAGMYRALPVRQNPRLWIVKSVLRTYIDALHISINQKDIIFKGSPNLVVADSDVAGPSLSAATSEVGSQVQLLSNGTIAYQFNASNLSCLLFPELD
jgi:hypothetical protein